MPEEDGFIEWIDLCGWVKALIPAAAIPTTISQILIIIFAA